MQSLNAIDLIVPVPAGILILRRAVQPEKAYSSINPNVFGKETLLRLVHPENAFSAIISIPSGIVTLPRLVQSEKAL